MFVAGVISFIQTIFLPGYIFLKLFRFKTIGNIQTIIYSFALSLLINYLVVYILTIFGLYTKNVLIILILCEVVLLINFAQKSKFILSLAYINFSFKRNQIISFILYIFGLYLLIFFAYLILLNWHPNSVFLTGDTIDAYNIWAKQWATGIIPIKTYHYPQLITTNWSISYVLLANPFIELFAKSIMPIFPFFILMLFLDLYNKTKSMSTLAGLVITGYLYKYFFDMEFIRDGYMDIAVSFFAFLTFYSLTANKKYKIKDLVLTLLFAAATMYTKQPGIYIFIFFSLWIAIIVIKKNMSRKSIQILIPLWLALIVHLILWYVPTINHTMAINAYNPLYLYKTTRPISDTYIQSIIKGVINLFHGIKSYFFLISILILYIVSLFNKKTRAISFLLILPILIFWILFLNYDQRNLTIIFPFVGYVCAVMFSNILKKITKQKITVITYRKYWFSKRLLIYIFVISCILVYVLSHTIYSDKNLVFFQTEGRKQIGDYVLNMKLYNYFEKNPPKGKILTNYFRLTNLPDLQKYAIYKRELVENIDLQDVPIRYLLINYKYNNSMHKSILKKFDGWVLYELDR